MTINILRPTIGMDDSLQLFQIKQPMQEHSQEKWDWLVEIWGCDFY